MLTTLMLFLLTLTPDMIRVTGNCYNVADQTSLKCNITVACSTTIQKVSADRSGKFTFEIPDSARYLAFESAGFETSRIDVNRIGSKLRL